MIRDGQRDSIEIAIRDRRRTQGHYKIEKREISALLKLPSGLPREKEKLSRNQQRLFILLCSSLSPCSTVCLSILSSSAFHESEVVSYSYLTLLFIVVIGEVFQVFPFTSKILAFIIQIRVFFP